MKTNEWIIAQVSPSTGPVQTQTQTSKSPNGASPDATGGVWTMLMPLLLIVGLYLLFMRPQMKKEKQLQAALKNLAKGDRVVTRGGIWGTIVGIKETEKIVVVKIAEDVKVEVNQSAIEAINPQKSPEKTLAKAADKKAEKKK